MGSYNYLGFGSFDEYCTPRVIESLKKFSASTCSSRVDAGTTLPPIILSVCLLLLIKLCIYVSSGLRVVCLWRKGTTSVHVELEECVAKYVGKHSAIVFGMGYATNSFIIPVLIGKVRVCIHIQTHDFGLRL